VTQPQAQSPAERAQAAQAGLAVIVAEDLAVAFPNLDLSDPKSIDLFTRLVRAVIGKYAPVSGALAMRGYRNARRAAGVTGAFTPTMASQPTAADVQAAVEWAITKQLLVPDPEQTQFEDALTKSGQKLVADVGRTTIVDNSRRDPEAEGWARIPEPGLSESGTCYFCAMLASRGAVYQSESTADFEAHPGCKCHAEVIFGRYEPSQTVQHWVDMWKTSTKGRHGADARAAFRQAVEGRPVTGLTRGPNAPKARKRAERAELTVTPEQARQLIVQLEQSNARSAGNPKLATMVAFNTRRIEEMRKVLAQPVG